MCKAVLCTAVYIEYSHFNFNVTTNVFSSVAQWHRLVDHY
jgi:hypothetical protein